MTLQTLSIVHNRSVDELIVISKHYSLSLGNPMQFMILDELLKDIYKCDEILGK